MATNEMARERIPEDVLRFLLNRIDSVPHLEALLLIAENPSKAWTQDELSARIYVARDQACAILFDLARQRLVRSAADGTHLYDPTGEEARLVPRVATTYREHLVRVAQVIHSKASPAVHEFARAFELKSKKE